MFSDKVIKATEFLLNLTFVKDVNFTSASENIKLLSSLNNSGSVHDGNSTVLRNISNYEPHIPDYIRTTSIIFCVIILCLGVIGNIMVPIVILKTKDMRNSTNVFLINLSVADLLVLLICTPTVLGKLVPFIELTVAHASILTILAISFERYYAICEPLKAGYVCTKTRAMIICVLCWSVAGLLTSPILEIANFSIEQYIDGSSVPVCLTSVDSFWPSFFFIGSISVFFLMPLFILIILYSVIAKHLMINPSLISGQGNRSNFIKYRKQVILMLAAVVVSFFTCLLPFRAFTLWIILVPATTIQNFLSTSRGIEIYYSVLYFCRCMWYLNSAMNPILYNLMSSKFREGFVKLLGCMPLRRVTSWSDSARKGTFHTTSTNLSSSNNGNAAEAQRLRNANLNDVKSVERAPLNVIKYVKIVVEEKTECFETHGKLENLDCESENLAWDERRDDTSEKSVNNSSRETPQSVSVQISRKVITDLRTSRFQSNHVRMTNVCPKSNDEIDTVANPEKDFCINIYNLLSAKESLV